MLLLRKTEFFDLNNLKGRNNENIFQLLKYSILNRAREGGEKEENSNKLALLK